MNITIAHIYYDLLNLYGENGNIKILKKQLESLGINVTLLELSLDDKLDFDQYDFVYIGCGTESNQKLALNHLIKYKKSIKENINKNKFYFITGNSIELFGSKINEENSYEGLSIFEYESNKCNQYANDAIFKTKYIKNYVIGFINQRSTITSSNSLFQVIKGYNKPYEGIKHNNFYGTYLLGPLLVRNPHLLKYLIKEIAKQMDFKIDLSKLNLKLDIKAYNNYLSIHYNECTKKQN